MILCYEIYNIRSITPRTNKININLLIFTTIKKSVEIIPNIKVITK